MYILEMTYLKMGEKRILFFNISGNTKIIYTLYRVSLMDMVDLKKLLCGFIFGDVKTFFQHKMKGKMSHNKYEDTVTSLKSTISIWITLYTLTRTSEDSYFILQILQVGLAKVQVLGFLAHGRGLLADSEEFPDFNFCPAVLEFPILSASRKKLCFQQNLIN